MHTLALTLVLLSQAPAVAENAPAPKPMVMADEDAPPSDAALASLDPEQKKEVLLAHEKARNGGIVAWAVPLGSFVFMLGAIAMILAAWVRIARERQLTVRHAIDKGVPASTLIVPPHPGTDRRRGVLLVAFGVGLGAVVGATSELIYATVGVLPLAVGAGYLVSFRLAEKKSADAPALSP